MPSAQPTLYNDIIHVQIKVTIESLNNSRTKFPSLAILLTIFCGDQPNICHIFHESIFYKLYFYNSQQILIKEYQLRGNQKTCTYVKLN